MATRHKAWLRHWGRIALILTLFVAGPAGPLTLIHPIGEMAPAGASDPVVCSPGHHALPSTHPSAGCAICHALYLLRWQPNARAASLVVDLTRTLPILPGDERSERHRPDAPAPSRAPPVPA